MFSDGKTRILCQRCGERWVSPENESAAGVPILCSSCVPATSQGHSNLQLREQLEQQYSDYLAGLGRH